MQHLQVHVHQISRLVQYERLFVGVQLRSEELPHPLVDVDERPVPGRLGGDESQERELAEQSAHHVDVGEQFGQQGLQVLQLFVVRFVSSARHHRPERVQDPHAERVPHREHFALAVRRPRDSIFEVFHQLDRLFLHELGHRPFPEAEFPQMAQHEPPLFHPEFFVRQQQAYDSTITAVKTSRGEPVTTFIPLHLGFGTSCIRALLYVPRIVVENSRQERNFCKRMSS